jgi:3-phytase
LTFGPDPFVSIPASLRAMPGDTVTVPVTIDDASGLEAVDLSIGYDTALLELVAVRPGAVTAGATLVMGPLTPGGSLTAGLVLASPLTSSRGGSLLELDYRVRPGAPSGPTPIDLQQVSLNEGWLVLTPTPVAGSDATDGLVTIVSASAPSTASETRAVSPMPRAIPGSAVTIRHGVRAPEGTPAGLVDLSGRVRSEDVASPTFRAASPWVSAFLLEVAASGADDPNREIRVELGEAPQVLAAVEALPA